MGHHYYERTNPKEPTTTAQNLTAVNHVHIGSDTSYDSNDDSTLKFFFYTKDQDTKETPNT